MTSLATQPAAAGDPAPAATRTREERAALLGPLIAQRILVIDGAMGTLIQSYQLDEAGFRGDDPRFRDHPRDLRGDNDLLSLTQPGDRPGDPRRLSRRRRRHHRDEHVHRDADRPGRLRPRGRRPRDERGGGADRPRGRRRRARRPSPTGRASSPARSGPTNRTASISPDVNDPAARNVTFEELAAAYQEAAEGLIEGGADILLIETIFDTLNGKAAIFGVEAASDAAGDRTCR